MDADEGLPRATWPARAARTSSVPPVAPSRPYGWGRAHMDGVHHGAAHTWRHQDGAQVPGGGGGGGGGADWSEPTAPSQRSGGSHAAAGAVGSPDAAERAEEEMQAYGRTGAESSVVRIRVIYLFSSITEPWRAVGSEVATGSGWFVRMPWQHPDEPTRYVVTASHMVRNVTARNGLLMQTMATGDARLRGRVVAVFPDIDGALIEVRRKRGVDPRVFRAWRFGDDRSVRSGTDVHVFGYPLSQDRLKDTPSTITGRELGMMQLDGAINPGHSGGPVVYFGVRGREDPPKGNAGRPHSALAEGVVIGWVSKGIPTANAIAFAQPITALIAALPGIFQPQYAMRYAQDAASARKRRHDLSEVYIIRNRSLGVRYFSSSHSRLIATGARTIVCDGEPMPRRHGGGGQDDAYGSSEDEDEDEDEDEEGAEEAVGANRVADARGAEYARASGRVQGGEGGQPRAPSCACASGVVVQWVSNYSPLRRPPFEIEPGDIVCSVTAPLVYADSPPIHMVLNDRGAARLPWSDGVVDLAAVIALVPVGSPMTVSVWKSADSAASGGRLVRGTVVPTPEAAVHGLFAPFRPYEHTEYEVFAGLVVAELTAEVMREFPLLSVRLPLRKRERPHLVIVNVFWGGVLNAVAKMQIESRMDSSAQGKINEIMSLEDDYNMAVGDILGHVNGVRVRTVAEYRAALRHPYQGRFLWISTDENRGDVVEMASVLRTEPLLAQQFGFPLSSTYAFFYERHQGPLPSGPAQHDEDSIAVPTGSSGAGQKAEGEDEPPARAARAHTSAHGSHQLLPLHHASHSQSSMRREWYINRPTRNGATPRFTTPSRPMLLPTGAWRALQSART